MELTPSYSSTFFSGDGETEKAQDHFGVQFATGVSESVDLRVRYEYIEIEDDGVRVRWQADRRVAKLPAQHVVPAPPYEPPPRRGQYALLRPVSLAQPWEPVRVVGATGDLLVVKDSGGNQRSVQLRNLVPLGKSSPP